MINIGHFATLCVGNSTVQEGCSFSGTVSSRAGLLKYLHSLYLTRLIYGSRGVKFSSTHVRQLLTHYNYDMVDKHVSDIDIAASRTDT